MELQIHQSLTVEVPSFSYRSGTMFYRDHIKYLGVRWGADGKDTWDCSNGWGGVVDDTFSLVCIDRWTTTAETIIQTRFPVQTLSKTPFQNEITVRRFVNDKFTDSVVYVGGKNRLFHIELMLPIIHSKRVYYASWRYFPINDNIALPRGEIVVALDQAQDTILRPGNEASLEIIENFPDAHYRDLRSNKKKYRFNLDQFQVTFPLSMKFSLEALQQAPSL